MICAFVLISGTGSAASSTECADGLDNDGDGFVDFGADPHCGSLSDNMEGPLELIVDTTLDLVDETPGDGLCDVGGGVCSLRAALTEANASIGNDFISVPAGEYGLSLSGPPEDQNLSGDLDVTDGVVIVGASAADTVIDPSAIDGIYRRIFHVLGGEFSIISSVTLRNGYNQGQEEPGGTAIANESVLWISESTITGGDGGQRGTVYNTGFLVLDRTNVVDNHASSAVFNDTGGTLIIQKSMIADNDPSGINQGGVRNFGNLVVQDSSILRNMGFYGGGIHNAGVAVIDRSLIAENLAQQVGGGIFGGNLVIMNSTVSGNRTGDIVAGITSAVLVSHSTITNNTALGFAPSIHGIGGSGSVEASIISNNRRESDGVVLNCSANLISLGGNVTDTDCGFTEPTDLSFTDPLLGPLADNGGPTDTHALLLGSPAIDLAVLAGCPSVDQRGLPRPEIGGTQCDSGAFELPEPGMIQMIAAGVGVLGLLSRRRARWGFRGAV